MKSDEIKLRCLLDVCNWQGGTIHQVATELGISVEDIINITPINSTSIDSDYMKGQAAYDTCTIDFIRRKIKPLQRHCPDFWKGYMKSAINNSGIKP